MDDCGNDASQTNPSTAFVNGFRIMQARSVAALFNKIDLVAGLQDSCGA
jgi:hypothetical protein